MSVDVSLPEAKTAVIMNGEELYEIINGERVELPSMGSYQSVLASMLDQILGSFAKKNQLGRVIAETLFQLDSEGKLQRRPDVAFVSYQRWPRKRRVPDTNAWDVIPELAIEVNSPSNTANEILRKIDDYFRSGVQRVWVVYPVTEQVYVYSSPTKNTILTKNDELDGETILPGFRFPVAELFDTDVEELPTSNGPGHPS